MNVEDLKREIEAMFPCKYENEFIQELSNTFKKYIDIVSCLDNIEDGVLNSIKDLCKRLIDVLKKYYDGRRGEAFMLFSAIMNGNKNIEDGLFSSIGNVNIDPDNYFYRTRERRIGVEFTILDMFHIPLNKRGIVSTQRYSSPGYPCLYLGNSVYSCWEEMRRPVFDNLMFSAYKVKYAFKVFDLRIPDESDYNDTELIKTINRIPLVLACSFVVKNTTDVFKPEYIIPQMLIETIISNSRQIIQSEKSILDPDVIWGVIYTSTHLNKDFPYGKQYLENIVLPVVETDGKLNYCQYLASLFEISYPLCYEYESLKENTTRTFWEESDREKTDEEKIKKQYNQSKMGFLEEKLKHTQFGVLPHLILGCPRDGVILDCNGIGPFSKMIIRSSGPFKIE